MKMPDAKTLAITFSKVLREWLSESEMSEVTSRNATPKYADCCASHDFCDANMAMHEAWVRCGIDPTDTGKPDTDFPLMSKECLELWGKAWGMAKEAGFDPDKIK